MQQYPTVTVRPHCKAHKSPHLAILQMELLGAPGVCCQKLSEAETMVGARVGDVLLSNEVVAPPKIRRLAALAAGGARVSVCVDDLDNVRALSDEAVRAETQLNVLVDVNVGQDRCGVDSPEEALRLVEAILEAPGIAFGGIQAYHGGIQHIRSYEQRSRAVDKVVELTTTYVDAIANQDIPIPCVTGGGTGTFEEHAASGVFTEVQPGSFCFGDADYARNITADGRLGEWEQSLWVLGTVISRSEGRNCAVLDTGMKAVSLDSGPPLVPESETDGITVEFKSGGDEHGILLYPEVWQMPTELPALGRTVRLMPGHCDPTVNLHDWIVAYRGDRVEAVWPIAARGPGV